MQKWEYKIRDVDGATVRRIEGEDPNKYMNTTASGLSKLVAGGLKPSVFRVAKELGDDGGELISIDNGWWVFKRAKA